MRKIRNGLILAAACLMLLLLVPARGQAEVIQGSSGDYQGIHWSITGDIEGRYEDECVLTISGSGAIPDFSNPNDCCEGAVLPPWLRCRWTYYDGETPDRFQNNAYFKGMGCPDGTFFTKIVIEPGITSIGRFAFCPCTYMCSYSGQTVLIVIPNTVTRIGDGAFYGLNHVDIIEIPDSVKELGKNLFYYKNVVFSCSSSSAAYQYAVSNGHYVSLTDLEASLTINGTTVKTSDYDLDWTYSPPSFYPQPSFALDPLTIGRPVPCMASVRLGTAVLEPKLSCSSALTLDASAGTLTANEDEDTYSISLYAEGTDYSKEIPKRIGFWVKVRRQTNVTYNLHGGKNSAGNPSVFYEGETIRLKKPTRKGYTFQGWYYHSTKVSTLEYNGNSVVLDAKWKKVTVPQVKSLKVTNQKTKKAVISFGKVQYVKGYQVQYATKSTFKSGTTKSKTVNTNKLTISSGLKKNGTYHVRVRAWKLDSKNGKVYGPWSDPVKVKIKK